MKRSIIKYKEGLNIQEKSTKMDKGTKRVKMQSSGKHNTKKKGHKSKICDKYGEHAKEVRRTKFVRRTKKARSPHISLKLECSH